MGRERVNEFFYRLEMLTLRAHLSVGLAGIVVVMRKHKIFKKPRVSIMDRP